ncbi:conserved hypothetical protein [Desulfovibrionales bacterium]
MCFSFGLKNITRALRNHDWDVANHVPSGVIFSSYAVRLARFFFEGEKKREIRESFLKTFSLMTFIFIFLQEELLSRILYGVQGVTHGHAMRAVAMGRTFGEHEFLFVTSEDAAGILRGEFRVQACLNMTTLYKGYKTDVLGTMKVGAKVFVRRGRQIRQLIRVAEDFRPDVAIYDYEYFVPQVAKKMGLPCLSIDHQHIITCCKHELPRDKRLDYHLQGTSLKLFFSKATDYLIISFYQPPVKQGHQVRVVKSILRDSVIERTPWDGEHVLVYQSCNAWSDLVPFLKTNIRRPCFIYGYGQDYRDGHLQFRKFSEQQLLDDLSSCAYVICGGGHTLMTEALYYGKPILSLPLNTAIEQYLNAFYLQKLGYGQYMDIFSLYPGLIDEFEARLEDYRKNVRCVDFCGNYAAFSLVNGFIRNGCLARVGNTM